MNEQAMKAGTEGTWYTRFNYYHRFIHVLIIVSFIGLVLTGMPLKYAHAGWAKAIAAGMGGFVVAGAVHRVCGVITFGYFLLHLIWLGIFLTRHNREPFLKFLLGPRSMLPWIKDVKDVMGHFRWFLGLGEKPKFDRFTYWEKFDYMAVFWGVGMIGISGLFLWWPVFFAQFFPGWVFNIATIIHSDEALLAAGFIFTIHFFNTHLRPEKFPLDHVIFTGRVSEHELKHERPLEYEYLVAEGKLESLRNTPPRPILLVWSHIIGIAAYFAGLFLIVLIIYAAISEIMR